MRRTNLGLLALMTVIVCCQFAVAKSQFFPPKYYGLGGKFLGNQVITADFNNDGVLDLAVGDALSNEVSILLGKPDGTFGSAIVFSVGYPLAICAGDMNNDGKQDLIVLEYGGTGNSHVGIFLGDGTGHFNQYGAYQAGIQSAGITAADFNGDGKLDVAVANLGLNGQGQSAMVFFGDGKGGLGSPKSYTLPGGKSGGPTAIAAGDLDGDGSPDLVVGVTDTRKGHLPYMAVLLNDGSGKFTISGEYSAGGNAPSGIVITDLDGDGNADMAVASFDALAILLNKGNGKFRKTTPTHQKIPIRTNFYIDLNHDKISDFRLFIYTGSLTCAMHPRTCSPWDAADMWAYPQVNGNALVGKQPFASALKGGVAVGPKESFDTSRGIMGGVSFINQDLKYSGAWANSGKWRKNRYLGFKFAIKGKIHYGWARFDVRVFRDPKSTVKAIMTGYAYETVANKPIVTGKTDTPVSTLGELAAGAVGRQ